MSQIQIAGGLIADVDGQDFQWLKLQSWSAHRSGKNVYAVGTLDRRTVLMHRLILDVTDRRWVVDHINGNGLDNRRTNLRLCSHTENLWNQRKRGTLSKYKGVNFRRDTQSNPWHAKITVNRKLIHLGSFATEIEAAKAYDVAALALRGEYARLNFEALFAEYLRCHPLAKKGGSRVGG